MSDLRSTLFVGNLSVFCSENDLENVFSRYGTILEIRMAKSEDKTKHLSYGFVKFANVASAQIAMHDLNNSIICGRPLRIGKAFSRSSKKLLGASNCPQEYNTASVHVTFLSHQLQRVVNEESLRILFSQFGHVVDAVICKSNIDEAQGKQSGYGFIHFPGTPSGIDASFLAAGSLMDIMIDEVNYKCKISHHMERQLRDAVSPVPPAANAPSQIPSQSAMPSNFISHGLMIPPAIDTEQLSPPVPSSMPSHLIPSIRTGMSNNSPPPSNFNLSIFPPNIDVSPRNEQASMTGERVRAGYPPTSPRASMSMYQSNNIPQYNNQQPNYPPFDPQGLNLNNNVQSLHQSPRSSARGLPPPPFNNNFDPRMSNSLSSSGSYDSQGRYSRSSSRYDIYASPSTIADGIKMLSISSSGSGLLSVSDESGGYPSIPIGSNMNPPIKRSMLPMKEPSIMIRNTASFDGLNSYSYDNFKHSKSWDPNEDLEK